MSLMLESLKSLKMADFLKEFKDKATWKKADFAIFLVGYKLDKKATVVLPFKKETDAKNAFKQLKTNKQHPLNKVAVGAFVWDDNQKQCTFTHSGGGAKLEDLEDKGGKLFGLLKMQLIVQQGAIDPEMQVAGEEAVSADDDELEENPITLDAQETGEERPPLNHPAFAGLNQKRILIQAQVADFAKANAMEKRNLQPNLEQAMANYIESCAMIKGMLPLELDNYWQWCERQLQNFRNAKNAPDVNALINGAAILRANVDKFNKLSETEKNDSKRLMQSQIQTFLQDTKGIELPEQLAKFRKNIEAFLLTLSEEAPVIAEEDREEARQILDKIRAAMQKMKAFN